MGRGREEILAEPTFAYRFVETESSVPAIETAAGLKTPIRVSADILSILAQRGREALGDSSKGLSLRFLPISTMHSARRLKTLPSWLACL